MIMEDATDFPAAQAGLSTDAPAMERQPAGGGELDVIFTSAHRMVKLWPVVKAARRERYARLGNVMHGFVCLTTPYEPSEYWMLENAILDMQAAGIEWRVGMDFCLYRSARGASGIETTTRRQA